MRDMEAYKKNMLENYPAYRLNCVVMETVEDILKDLPEFAAYFALCRKQAEHEWRTNYKRGRSWHGRKRDCSQNMTERFRKNF